MMKKKINNRLIALLTAVLFCVGTQTLAQERLQPMQDIDAFKEGMKIASAGTNSIGSDFEQLKHLSFLEEDVLSRGVFYFQKENKLRWEYSEPFFYLIIFNKDTVVIQDDRKTNVYDAASGQMFRQINDIMLSLVNGTILESKDFTFDYYEDATFYQLALTPLDENMKDFLSEILLTIDRKDFSAEELYMVEPSGDYTHIRFINKKLNEAIPHHTFDLP
jgi:outer membrane lipoprotein-sorting protein